jgi:hypothetical protein
LLFSRTAKPSDCVSARRQHSAPQRATWETARALFAGSLLQSAMGLNRVVGSVARAKPVLVMNRKCELE